MVQGAKSVLELLHSDYETEKIYVTSQFLDQYKIPSSISDDQIEVASEKQIAELSTFQSNDFAIAIAKMKENIWPDHVSQPLIFALDDVRDPGNMGTIIRTADWYGLSYVVASSTSTDMYNPKVVNATMGSFSRVQVYYTELDAFLRRCKQKYTIYGADMNGENVHESTLQKPAILVMGNESKGLSKETEQLLDKVISIPRFGQAESLNVALSTAILCDNFMRAASSKPSL